MAKSNRLRDDWGSVSYDPARKVGRIRYWSATPEGYRRVSETVRGTRRDVERRRAELRLTHDADAPCPTIGELYTGFYHPWRQRRADEGKLGRQTLRQEESTWRCHVCPMWERSRADAIRPALVQDWLDGLTTNQAQAATKLLRGLMRFAVLRGLVQVDPIAGVTFEMPAHATSQDRGVWSLDELGAIWRGVRGAWWEPAFLLMAFGSARPGESLGPLAGEVERQEVDGVTVAVVPCVRQVANAGGISDRLKNGWSRRPLVLPGPMGERVVEIARANPGDWLTSDGTGLPTSQDRLRKAFRDALRECGAPVHPLRNLRPSWQTYMHWDLNVAPDRIEKMMGHVGIGSKVTATHYDRPDAESFAQTAAQAYRRHPFADAWFAG